MEDKRRHPRYPLLQETTYFSTLGDTPTGRQIRCLGTLTNISEGGVGARVLFEHHPGERILFEQINGDGRPRAAIVKWLRPSPSSGWYEIGAEFLT